MTLNEKDYLTVNEAAEYLGIGLSSARKYLKLIGAERRIGKSCRYDRRAIKAYLDEKGSITLEKAVQ